MKITRTVGIWICSIAFITNEDEACSGNWPKWMRPKPILEQATEKDALSRFVQQSLRPPGFTQTLVAFDKVVKSQNKESPPVATHVDKGEEPNESPQPPVGPEIIEEVNAQTVIDVLTRKKARSDLSAWNSHLQIVAKSNAQFVVCGNNEPETIVTFEYRHGYRLVKQITMDLDPSLPVDEEIAKWINTGHDQYAKTGSCVPKGDWPCHAYELIVSKKFSDFGCAHVDCQNYWGDLRYFVCLFGTLQHEP